MCIYECLKQSITPYVYYLFILFIRYNKYLIIYRINYIYLKKYLRKHVYTNNNDHYFVFISQNHYLHLNEKVT